MLPCTMEYGIRRLNHNSTDLLRAGRQNSQTLPASQEKKAGRLFRQSDGTRHTDRLLAVG